MPAERQRICVSFGSADSLAGARRSPIGKLSMTARMSPSLACHALKRRRALESAVNTHAILGAALKNAVLTRFAVREAA